MRRNTPLFIIYWISVTVNQIFCYAVFLLVGNTAAVILITVIALKIGENIKRLLTQRDITQKAFAAMLNIPYTTLNGYLRDTYEPDIEMVKRIATALGVSIDLLLDCETPQTIRLDEQEFELVQKFRVLDAQQQELILQQANLMAAQNAREEPKSNTSSSDGKHTV
jgi:transcriptional regulator with XRE-family HTH domain